MGYGNYIIEAPGYEELEELRGAVKEYLEMGGFPYTESVHLGNPPYGRIIVPSVVAIARLVAIAPTATSLSALDAVLVQFSGSTPT